MVGSHDSFTYLPSRHKVLEVFSFMWRTQNKSIEEQIKTGVSFLDIRVRRVKQNWVVCHGLVDFDLQAEGLDYFLEFCIRNGCTCRIILERGNIPDQFLFMKEINTLKEAYKDVLKYACIKQNWKVLLNQGIYVEDYSYKFWYGYNLISKIKNLLFNNIKHNSKNNPCIVPDMLKSNIIYFMDYV